MILHSSITWPCEIISQYMSTRMGRVMGLNTVSYNIDLKGNHDSGHKYTVPCEPILNYSFCEETTLCYI